MDEISYEELQEVVNQTNNWKALGLSGISYDHIKHSGNIMKTLILSLMNICLKTQKLPEDWLHRCVYPIPKKEEWEGDIKLIRPITLIKCCRKLFFKIITNRLTKILKVHNILRGYNFAALQEKLFQTD